MAYNCRVAVSAAKGCFAVLLSRTRNCRLNQFLTWVDIPLSHPYFSCLFLTMKTFSAKATEVPRKWWVIDAEDQVLGRVAVEAANLLRGKGKTIFTPHVDTGDFVIVINAEKSRLPGKKEEQKYTISLPSYVSG